MRQVLEGRNFTSTEQFVKELNKARLEKPNSWFTYVGVVNGKSVQLKSFNTGHLQILRVDGLNHPVGMDINVTAWKRAITEAIN